MKLNQHGYNSSSIFGIALLLLISVYVHAATTPDKEDIHYLAEHLAEAAQDARYFAMPWPVGNYKDKEWKPLVSIAGASANAGFADATGGLFTFGMSRALTDNWALELVAYYDQFNVSGSHTSSTLSSFSVNGVPLDLPETAIFSSPRGVFTHTGAGFIISHALESAKAWHWDVLGGMFYEELTLSHYQFDYQLTGGANAGATGVLDHSGSNKLIYGVLGLQARTRLNANYEMVPRIVLGLPFKNGDFNGRITGQNFDLSTQSTAASPHRIGDGFIYMGMTILDVHSHFEMDLGVTLGYETFEVLAHKGIQSALIASLTWRM